LLLIYLYIVSGFVKFSIASNIINVLNEDLMADIISSIAQQYCTAGCREDRHKLIKQTVIKQTEAYQKEILGKL